MTFLFSLTRHLGCCCRRQNLRDKDDLALSEAVAHVSA